MEEMQSGLGPLRHSHHHRHCHLTSSISHTLQAYMGQLMTPLNAALNKIAKERPAEPLKALAALLAE